METTLCVHGDVLNLDCDDGGCETEKRQRTKQKQKNETYFSWSFLNWAHETFGFELCAYMVYCKMCVENTFWPTSGRRWQRRVHPVHTRHIREAHHTCDMSGIGCNRIHLRRAKRCSSPTLPTKPLRFSSSFLFCREVFFRRITFALT